MFITRHLSRHRPETRWGLITAERAGIGIPVPAYWLPEWTVPALKGMTAAFRVAGAGGQWAWGPGVVDPPMLLESGNLTGLQKIEVRLSLGAQVVYEATDIAEVVLVPPEDLLTRRNEPALGDLVRTLLNARLIEDSGTIAVLMSDRADTPQWQSLDCGVGVRIEVIVGDAVVGEAIGGVEWERPVWKTWQILDVTWRESGRERLLAGRDRAQLRITGDAREAARIYLRWPFDKPDPACWTGSYTTPAAWVEESQ